ncbi:hypothetical protein LENED_008239 [Lentinula edodes]|uniref:Uncharacterized protein n=1 Tax=Lentinula edodes TaxID=5353 RepID=A0A1Q3EGI6_LENED|nr:hypothetical protein LENED_008239 [Lentinula edodes]
MNSYQISLPFDVSFAHRFLYNAKNQLPWALVKPWSHFTLASAVQVVTEIDFRSSLQKIQTLDAIPTSRTN